MDEQQAPSRFAWLLDWAGEGTGRRALALNPLLLTSLALLGGALVVEHRLATLLVGSVIFAVLFRRMSRLCFLACALCFGFSALRAESEVHRYDTQWRATRAELGAPQRCAVQGRVLTSPVWRSDSLSFTAELTKADCERGLLSMPVRARLYGGPKHLARGDHFDGVAQLGIVRLFRNFEQPDPRVGAARREAILSGSLLSLQVTQPSSSWTGAVDGFRAHVRTRIESTFAGPAVGMAKALVLGENDLTEEEDLAFRESGLAHLLAVSGTHLVFAVVSLVAALGFVLVRIPALAERTHVLRWASLFGAVLALGYADFAGGSGSAWRAAWMLAAAFVVRGCDRRPSVAVSIAFSILVGVVFDALAVFDLSFMLSLAATTGLVTLGRRFARVANHFRRKPVKLFLEGLAATLSSIIPCSALLAMLAPRLSMPGMVLNVLAAPFGEIVALPLCLLHTVLAPLPWLEQGTATVASGALLIVKQAAFLSTRCVDAMPVLGVPLVAPNAGHFAVVAVAIVLYLELLFRFAGSKHLICRSNQTDCSSRAPAQWLRARVAFALATTLALVSVEVRARHDGSPRGVLRVSVLDVGQGDSALVDLPDGRLMLIDAGGFVGSPVDPGERVVLPLLRARRREHIDIVVLSHPHPDHFGGLGAVVETLSVGEFWDTGQGRKEGAGPAYAALMQSLQRRGVPIRGPDELCGTQWLGGARLDVVGPCPSAVPGRNANDNSWVFRLSYHGRAALFTGDAEGEQEHELLQSARSSLKADLLKVGHHGSRTSTSPEFLAAVSPHVATLSCGVRNRFGHPHPVTLDTLQAQGVLALRLDDLGAVEWWTDGTDVAFQTYYENTATHENTAPRTRGSGRDVSARLDRH